jgi:hypothetical protein
MKTSSLRATIASAFNKVRTRSKAVAAQNQPGAAGRVQAKVAEEVATFASVIKEAAANVPRSRELTLLQNQIAELDAQIVAKKAEIATSRSLVTTMCRLAGLPADVVATKTAPEIRSMLDTRVKELALDQLECAGMPVSRPFISRN